MLSYDLEAHHPTIRLSILLGLFFYIFNTEIFIAIHNSVFSLQFISQINLQKAFYYLDGDLG